MVAGKKDYADVSKRIYDLLISKKKDEAVLLLNSDGVKVSNELNKVIDASVKMNIEAAQKTSDDNTKLANSTTLIMIIVLIIGLIAAIIIAFLFANKISNAIKACMEFAGKISMGDLSGSVEITNTDEIGQLASSLNNMGSALALKAQVVETISKGDINLKYYPHLNSKTWE
ncbi:HAMP domain-containing protein [Candidatus Poribacteria bacterium]|nr:HAMP domain-containing protein [Candidatus Poribacteria bacterium]